MYLCSRAFLSALGHLLLEILSAFSALTQREGRTGMVPRMALRGAITRICGTWLLLLIASPASSYSSPRRDGWRGVAEAKERGLLEAVAQWFDFEAV